MWVNNERLVFTSADKTLAQGEIDFAPGLYAVNRDGTRYRQLAERHNAFIREQSALPAAALEYLHAAPAGAEGARFNLRGRSAGQPRRIARCRSAAPQHRHRTLRVRAASRRIRAASCSTSRANRASPTAAKVADGVVWYRDPQNEQWRELARFTSIPSTEGFTPLAFGPDGTLYVTTRMNSDKAALYRFDFSHRQSRSHARAAGGRLRFQWQHHQRQGQAAGRALEHRCTHHGMVRRRHEGAAGAHRCTPARHRQPGVGAARAIAVGAGAIAIRRAAHRHPAVQHGDGRFQQGRRRAQPDRSQADGPPGPGALQGARRPRHPGLADPARTAAARTCRWWCWCTAAPMCAAHVWGWNADAQFLASRGYAVLEPEFRGSTGYGFDHFKAGWKQWGLAMQNDIADGTRWAIAQRRGRPQAHLHRRRQLRRLCHLDGIGERPGAVPLRHRLGRRHRHRPAVFRPLELQFRPARRLQTIRHAGADRRPADGSRHSSRPPRRWRRRPASPSPCCWPTAAPTAACPCTTAASSTMPSRPATTTSNSSATTMKATAGHCRRLATISGPGSSASSTKISENSARSSKLSA